MAHINKADLESIISTYDLYNKTDYIFWESPNKTSSGVQRIKDFITSLTKDYLLHNEVFTLRQLLADVKDAKADAEVDKATQHVFKQIDELIAQYDKTTILENGTVRIFPQSEASEEDQITRTLWLSDKQLITFSRGEQLSANIKLYTESKDGYAQQQSLKIKKSKAVTSLDLTGTFVKAENTIFFSTHCHACRWGCVMEGLVYQWDLKTNQASFIDNFGIYREAGALAVTPSQKTLLVAVGGQIVEFDILNPAEIKRWKIANNNDLPSITAMQPISETEVVVGTKYGVLAVVDLHLDKVKYSYQIPRTDQVREMKMMPDQKHVAAFLRHSDGDKKDKIVVYHPETGLPKQVFNMTTWGYDHNAYALSIFNVLSNGNFAIYDSFSKRIEIMDSGTGQSHRAISLSSQQLVGFSVAANGALLLAFPEGKARRVPVPELKVPQAVRLTSPEVKVPQATRLTSETGPQLYRPLKTFPTADVELVATSDKDTTLRTPLLRS